MTGANQDAKSHGSDRYTCGLDAAIDIVGGKWKPMVLWALSERSYRFGALRRELAGVSEKVLIQQLRELERDAIVDREVHDLVPPKVEYSLTDLGRSLYRALEPLGAWGEAHLDHITSVRPAQDDASGTPTRQGSTARVAESAARPVR